jgi:mono/diheme cytochrome c family protein
MLRRVYRSLLWSFLSLPALVVCDVTLLGARQPAGREGGARPAVATSQAGRAGPTAPRRGGNPEAASIKNPVPATPESVAAGKRAYGQLCANCHGPSGKGDGTVAGTDQPSDLTDGVWDFGSTDGEIFTVIRDGLAGKDMGGYAERLTETDLWNVVNFVRTLAQK